MHASPHHHRHPNPSCKAGWRRQEGLGGGGAALGTHRLQSKYLLTCGGRWTERRMEGRVKDGWRRSFFSSTPADVKVERHRGRIAFREREKGRGREGEAEGSCGPGGGGKTRHRRRCCCCRLWCLCCCWCVRALGPGVIAPSRGDTRTPGRWHAHGQHGPVVFILFFYFMC